MLRRIENLYLSFVIVLYSYKKILCNLAMKMDLLRFLKNTHLLLTSLIHNNGTGIDFFFLFTRMRHNIIKHSFNENITELKIIC